MWPKAAGLGGAHLGGNQPVCPKPRARLGTPPGNQVSPGSPAVTFPLWVEPPASNRGCQGLPAEGGGGLCFLHLGLPGPGPAAHVVWLAQDLEVESTRPLRIRTLHIQSPGLWLPLGGRKSQPV